MTDIVERLRDWSEYDEGKINDAREEAADEIERLRAALHYIAWEQREDDKPHLIARAALGGGND